MNETDWPEDPRLDIFRAGVWELSLKDEVQGWVTTSISPTRVLPAFWLKLERMWTQVHWIDGGHEYLEEDYGPGWYSAEELRSGCFVTAHPGTGVDTRLNAVAVLGSDRDRLWAELDHGVEPQDR